MFFSQTQWSRLLRFQLVVEGSAFLRLVRFSRRKVFRRLLVDFLVVIGLKVPSFASEKLDECFKVLFKGLIILDSPAYLTLEG